MNNKINKLVRDKIIDKIEKNGHQAKYHLADQDEYESKLLEKLNEEVKELISDKNESEVADVLEVIAAICELYKFDLHKIDKIQKEKKEKSGGFEKRIILEETFT